MQVIGWSMWFSEYLFLERSWAKDESTIKVGLQRLKDYPQPFWSHVPKNEAHEFREQRKHDKKVCCLGLTSLLTLPSDQLPGIMYVSMPSYNGVFICLEAAKEEPKDDDGMDDGLETDDGEDDGSDNDMGDDA
ncbi:hypothetical protein Tco_1173750 [Tanacetum coccineum]